MKLSYKGKSAVVTGASGGMGLEISKRLSQNHNVAIVPYAEGQSIGKAMKLRFVQSDEIYNIKIPNPDYHIAIEIKGFKKLSGFRSAIIIIPTIIIKNVNGNSELFFFLRFIGY